MAAGPLIASAVRQWENAPGVGASSLLVVHALDTLPRIGALTEPTSAWRCVATTRGIAAVHARYGDAAGALNRRFTLCVVHAPRDDAFAREESEALRTFIATRHSDPRLLSAPASARELMSLRQGEQILATASLRTPVICRTLSLPRKPNAAPSHTDHGEAMPIPKAFIAFLATLVATSAGAGDVAPSAVPAAVARGADTIPMVEAKLGPHRFRFPKNLYYQQSGPDADGGVMLNVRWPSLQPLALGKDYHEKTEDFLSHVSIDLAYPSRLTDAEYRRLLRRSIEPFDPTDETSLANPAENLSLRIKGDAVLGLVPYMIDFDKLRPYNDKLYGPGTRASDPEANDDWYLPPGADVDAPLTVISCTSRLIRDGAKVENGTILDESNGGRRSTCTHEFLIPELRLVARLSYLRVILPDWERIERHVRELVTKAEVR